MGITREIILISSMTIMKEEENNPISSKKWSKIRRINPTKRK